MGYRGGNRKTEKRDRREDGLDATFALLSDARRRFVLAYLRDQRRATLDELADVVSGWEQARRGDAIATPDQRHQVAVRLHHVDLPKLDSAGVIDYDYSQKQVTSVDLPEVVDDFLAAVGGWQADEPDERDDHTSRRRSW